MTQGRGYKVDAAIRVNGVGARRLRDWQWLANITNISLFGGRGEVRGNIDGKIGKVVIGIIAEDCHLAIGDLIYLANKRFGSAYGETIRINIY